MPAGHGHMTLEFSYSAWLVNGWYPTADQRFAGCCDEEIHSRYQYQLNFITQMGTRNGAFFIAEKREVIMRKL